MNLSKISENEIYKFFGISNRESYTDLSDEEYDEKLKKRKDELMAICEKEGDFSRKHDIELYYFLIQNQKSRNSLKNLVNRRKNNKDSVQKENDIMSNQKAVEEDLYEVFYRAYLDSYKYKTSTIKASVNIQELPDFIDAFNGFINEIYNAGSIFLEEGTIEKSDEQISGYEYRNNDQINEFYYRINQGLDSKGAFLKAKLNFNLMKQDPEYREFVFNRLMSKESIQLANYFTSGYVGTPIKDHSTGKWRISIDPVLVVIARKVEELKKSGRLVQPKIPRNIINSVEDMEIL
ncbi:MAG: hypothetical protein IKT41_05945 [Clostridia bacterium]|nr:hypothetical protein [Clostridia bacterium]